MKNLKHLFTALLLLCSTMAFAEEVTIDGIKYNVITKAKQATVISGGNFLGDIIIPETVEYNGVTCSVTSIGDYAFQGCSGLTSIIIPNSVTSIGDYAFYYSFGLTSIEIPNSVTSIGECAFCDCGLTAVYISDLSAWCNIDFDGDYANPLCYAKNLYLNGELVTNLVIPDGITKINNYAFSGCDGLTSITIGNSVTSIGASAFYNCTGLTSITIGNSVTSIGNSAFYGCSGLTSVTIGSSVTSIGYSAFYGCMGLTSVIIGSSVTSIGQYAFSYCSGLTSITIPNSVTSIGYSAFEGCSGLTSVTIGSGLRCIYSKAFAYCSSLTDVYCHATTMPTDPVFDIFEKSYPEYMTLHVPAEAINDYKTTEPWNYFGHIVTLSGEVVETPVCATPALSYNNGKLVIDCETEGAEFVTDVTCGDIQRFYDSEINFSATYNISVYAIATGYENSETVNATLCWIENGNIDNETNVINIPATAVFITSRNGELSTNCALDGESVEVYTTGGVLVGTTTIANGNATIQTALSKGSMAIVKIGDKSVKVILN